MLALLGAFVAGVLTTLAPCVLPLLPVIVGGSITGVAGAPAATPSGDGTVATRTRRTALRRALIITGSLGASVIVFTLVLKATTALIGVPPEVWQWVSAAILIGLGLTALFPSLWERISTRASLQGRTGAGLARANRREGVTGEVLTGVALGPVFTSCSPLYGYVIVTVLPSEPVYGLVLLLAYVIGLCGTLLAIAVAGQRLLRNATWITDPHSWVRRGLGAVFIIVGLLIAAGVDKSVQSWVLENSPIAPWELDSGFIPEP